MTVGHETNNGERMIIASTCILMELRRDIGWWLVGKAADVPRPLPLGTGILQALTDAGTPKKPSPTFDVLCCERVLLLCICLNPRTHPPQVHQTRPDQWTSGPVASGPVQSSPGSDYLPE